MKKPAVPPAACPCGKGPSLENCCGRFIAGTPAPDAEALMRSRYTAYTLGERAYLLATWHPSTRPAELDLDAGGAPRWLGLEVRRHLATGPDAAIVEFVARYKVGGRAHRLHEVSRFLREDGHWYYLDGEFPEAGQA